jgi:hypothetical protein
MSYKVNGIITSTDSTKYEKVVCNLKKADLVWYSLDLVITNMVK